MDKLIKGLQQFHANPDAVVKALFGQLVLDGQHPQALLITCADSRVQPEFMAHSDPGDIFMVRNVGNLVPTRDEANLTGNHSIGAALEFGLANLGITDIVILGHGCCGAMKALLTPGIFEKKDHLTGWLDNARTSLTRFEDGLLADVPGLSDEDRMSQVNVICQMDHVRGYDCVRERLERRAVRIHGWFFDMANARILAYTEASGRFLPLEEAYSPSALSVAA